MSMGGHQSTRMKNDEWLTPPEILRALGKFDLDPCAPVLRPWDTATKHYTVMNDGLVLPWAGRVWLNPPYGRQTGKWLSRLHQHGEGTALIFARTETDDFFTHVWEKANAVLFIRGRLHFHHVCGRKADNNAGAPSVLVAYGQEDAAILGSSTINGQFVLLKKFDDEATL